LTYTQTYGTKLRNDAFQLTGCHSETV